MTKTMTITRALSELKLLNNRIQKQINNTLFVDSYQKRNSLTGISRIRKEDFEKNVKAEYQSIKDLIELRQKIKSAIIKSNSEQTVKINDVVYTVAEAIDRKSSIEYEKQLMDKLRQDYVGVNTNIKKASVELDDKVQRMLEQNLGTDKKADKEAYENIAKPFIEQNEWLLIDPIKAQEVINELDKKIDGFLSEVDFVLSESNAKTEITV